MSIVSSLLFAVSASLDALLIGITYGIRKVRIHLLHNLLISLITLAGTVLAIFLGKSLTPLLSRFPLLAQNISRGGSVILLGMGFYYLLKPLLLRIKHKKPDIVSAASTDNVIRTPIPDTAQLLTFRELALLGVGLSLNNMGIGIGASMAGIADQCADLISASVLTFLCSVCFLLLGNSLGHTKSWGVIDQYTDLISGLLLILLGVFQIFT